MAHSAQIQHMASVNKKAHEQFCERFVHYSKSSKFTRDRKCLILHLALDEIACHAQCHMMLQSMTRSFGRLVDASKRLT